MRRHPLVAPHVVPVFDVESRQAVEPAMSDLTKILDQISQINENFAGVRQDVDSVVAKVTLLEQKVAQASSNGKDSDKADGDDSARQNAHGAQFNPNITTPHSVIHASSGGTSSQTDGTLVPTASSTGSGTEDVDLQAEFQAIKRSLQDIRLKPDLTLNETRAGIARADQGSFDILQKTARYIESASKLLISIKSVRNSRSEPIPVLDQVDLLHADLSVVLCACMRYLQGKYAGLLVQGQYGRETSRMFESLSRNTSSFNAASLDRLQTAVQLTAARATGEMIGRGQGRGRQNFRRGPNRFQRGSRYRGDVFSHMQQQVGASNRYDMPDYHNDGL